MIEYVLPSICCRLLLGYVAKCSKVPRFNHLYIRLKRVQFWYVFFVIV